MERQAPDLWNDKLQTWLDAARSEPLGKTIEALVPVARSPYQPNAVAVHELLVGDVPAALATSASLRCSPDCWICFHNRAAALFASGQASGALEAERIAQVRQSENASPRLVAMVRTALAFYSQAASDPQSGRGAAKAGTARSVSHRRGPS